MRPERFAPLPADDAAALWALAATFPDHRLSLAYRAAGTPRAAALTLMAFAGELAQIPARVSEPHMAAIRFAFWRDEIMAQAEGAVPKAHPLARSLGAVRDILSSGGAEAFLEAAGEDAEAGTSKVRRLEGALAAALARLAGEGDTAPWRQAGEGTGLTDLWAARAPFSPQAVPLAAALKTRARPALSGPRRRATQFFTVLRGR